MNIFRSVHNVNLETVIGYRKGDFKYNFLDDYEIQESLLDGDFSCETTEEIE